MVLFISSCVQSAAPLQDAACPSDCFGQMGGEALSVTHALPPQHLYAFPCRCDKRVHILFCVEWGK